MSITKKELDNILNSVHEWLLVKDREVRIQHRTKGPITKTEAIDVVDKDVLFAGFVKLQKGILECVPCSEPEKL